jgi:hypothetical protein
VYKGSIECREKGKMEVKRELRRKEERKDCSRRY